jgi:hypothetical protein
MNFFTTKENFTGFKKNNKFDKDNTEEPWKKNDLLQNSSLLKDYGVENNKTFKNLDYNTEYNGIVNIMDEMDLLNKKIAIQDKIPIEKESSDFREALNGTLENNLLSQVYFCKENIQIVQNGIRSSVFKCSKKIIDQQPIDTIKIIMRSIFLQNAKHFPTKITEQVEILNNLVINECSKKINTELDSYLKYKRDISTLAKPIDRPTSTYKNQVLEFKGYFESPDRTDTAEKKPRIFSDIETLQIQTSHTLSQKYLL